MERRDVTGLPDDPIAAAASFYRWITSESGRSGDIVLVFPAADHTHMAWRLAAVQSLARQRVPGRVNALCGGSEAARAAAIDYLSNAPGLTGQVLVLDDTGAGPVIPSSA